MCSFRTQPKAERSELLLTRGRIPPDFRLKAEAEGHASRVGSVAVVGAAGAADTTEVGGRCCHTESGASTTMSLCPRTPSRGCAPW